MFSGIFSLSHRELSRDLRGGGVCEEGTYLEDQASRKANVCVVHAGVNGMLSDPSLRKPGFKLITTADWDYNSTVFLLDDFITQARA